ncbi:MAG: FAD-dependent oxidoreductase, partial [Alphaproteobacteria bacterium]
AKVLGAAANGDGVQVTIQAAAGGPEENLEADAVLVAVGRRPYTEGLGLERAGVALDNRGFVKTDDQFRTNVPGIYAIGDARPGPMLAHKASEEGVAAAELMAGRAGHVNYEVIPAVVYTAPEVAAVGRTEDELKSAGVGYKLGKFPFSANSRARCNAETDGLVKIVTDSKTDRVLGVHILGPEAGTLVHEVAVAMEFGASAEDIARTCHGHPTLSEAVKEAALAAYGLPLHI